MSKYHILWADDEIDLLKPHILFLQGKGYQVTSVNNGSDALDLAIQQEFDIVFLDENMPGLSGLETLAQMKNAKPNLPVVMITKSEEEHIMEDAIGSKISDYLIKPLNPNQILLSVKRILDNRRLVSEKTNMTYQQDFRNISMAFSDDLNPEEWAELYKKLVFHEREIEQTPQKSMAEVLNMQKDEANTNFIKFYTRNYERWLNNPDAEKPLLSHQLFKKKVLPRIEGAGPLFFIVIDNFRLDQWKMIEPLVNEFFNTKEDSHYYSILPTATAFARNAIFSGLMPAEIAKQYPNLWVGDDEEEGKNNFEDELLAKQIERNRLNIKFSYHKILNTQQGKELSEKVNNLMNNKLNAIVYNFVDMLSHARTDSGMIRELIPDEAAYRSLTLSWFTHSPLFDLLKEVAAKKGRVIITTDHGTMRVKKPFKIIGDRSVNTNLRYKQGKNLGYDEKDGDAFTILKPEQYHLPKLNVSTRYVFATGDAFFAYPNNYNYYVNYFKDTFQHGGISLEEVIVPLVYLEPK